jgi:hypothetical protein
MPHSPQKSGFATAGIDAEVATGRHPNMIVKEPKPHQDTEEAVSEHYVLVVVTLGFPKASYFPFLLDAEGYALYRRQFSNLGRYPELPIISGPGWFPAVWVDFRRRSQFAEFIMGTLGFTKLVTCLHLL